MIARGHASLLTPSAPITPSSNVKLLNSRGARLLLVMNFLGLARRVRTYADVSSSIPNIISILHWTDTSRAVVAVQCSCCWCQQGHTVVVCCLTGTEVCVAPATGHSALSFTLCELRAGSAGTRTPGAAPRFCSLPAHCQSWCQPWR